MNKDQLAQRLADKINVSKKDALQQVNDVLEIIEDTLETGERINIVNFGSFEVRERAARVGRNPKTGEPIQIEAQKGVKFTPGKGLNQKVKK